MSLFGCPVEHIQLEVESSKCKCLFWDYDANVAWYEVASVDEKVKPHLVNGLAMV